MVPGSLAALHCILVTKLLLTWQHGSCTSATLIQTVLHFIGCEGGGCRPDSEEAEEDGRTYLSMTGNLAYENGMERRCTTVAAPVGNQSGDQLFLR